MILFLSHYPTNETIKDGMSQRITNIDEYFSSDERIYLNVSFRKFIKKKTRYQENIIILNLNFFIHFFEICNYFFKAKKIYIHSVFNALQSLLLINFIKNDYILDVHGVVPEENLLEGKKYQYHIFNFCEKIVFKKAKYIICVTEAMKNHYFKKFPKSKANYIIFPILPNTITEKFELTQLEDSNTLLNIVYSGNTQKWQNIELMSVIIAKNLSPNIKYYILTGNVLEMNEIIGKKVDLPNKQIEILSVNPEDLKEYYVKCHYGFILRDDIVVNNVSCPTKLIEYMYYGITPIVLSPSIGDFEKLGYNYVTYNQMFGNFTPIKSNINHQIIKQLMVSQISKNLREIVLS